MEYVITEEKMSLLQIRQYLERLQITEPVQPDLETLRRLQYQHLLHIPYENLDSMVGRITSLNHEALFEKLIAKKRGGICFELNGAYAWLLESLGYAVKNHAARFIARNDPIQMRRHRVMTVTLGEDRYLTDVGVNQESPRCPLLLEEELVQSDGVSEYKLTRDPFWGWLLWQKLTGHDWKRIYGFTEEPQLDIDYVMPCVFCDVHPLSPINKFYKISIFTPDANIRIWDDEFTVFKQGAETERRKVHSQEFNELLKVYFGIGSADLTGVQSIFA